MKRLGLTIVILLVAISGCAITESGTERVPRQRALNKMVAQKKREFGKEGWRLLDTCQNIEVVLSSFYASLSDDKTELVGKFSMCVSWKLGKQGALNSSHNNYILEAERYFTNLLGCTSGCPPEFFEALDKMKDSYLEFLNKELKDCIEPRFWVLRPTGSRTKEGKERYEFKVYCLLDENKASEIRHRAMEKALQNSEMMQPFTERFYRIAEARVMLDDL